MKYNYNQCSSGPKTFCLNHPLSGGPSFFISPLLSVALGFGTVCFRKPFPCCREQIMFKNVFVRAFAPTRDSI